MPADENFSVPAPEKKWQLGFWSLIATQFQGAFNDNGLKFFVIFLILGTNPTASEKDLLVFVIGNLFALPFILFSMAGGYLADRYSKRSVAIGTKIFEIFAMIFAVYAFWNGNSRMAFAVIFLASTQAAFFGPAKYGLLPEVLPAELLSWGNGILELTTFLAIIAGAVVGPILAQSFHGRAAIAGLIFGACSLLGLAASFFISRVPPADPSKKFQINILGDLRKQVQLVRPDRVLHLAIAGNTYFWFRGRIALGWKDRIWPHSSWRHGNVRVRIRNRDSRAEFSPGVAPAWSAWFYGRIFYCPDQRPDSTPTRGAA